MPCYCTRDGLGPVRPDNPRCLLAARASSSTMELYLEAEDIGEALSYAAWRAKEVEIALNSGDAAT